MNSTTQATNTAPANRGRHRSIRTTIIGLVLSAGAALGFSATNTTPASAATGISWCFRHTNGSPYTYDTYLAIYRGGRWVAVTSLGRSPTGCRSASIPAAYRNYATMVSAYYQLPNGVWFGHTPRYAPAGVGTYNLGTGMVNS